MRANARRAIILAVLLVGAGILGGVATFAVANYLSNSADVDGDIPIHAPNGPLVTIDADSDELNMTDMFPASDTVRVNATIGNMTVSGDNFANVTIGDGIEGEWTEVTAIEADGQQLTLDPYDKAPVGVSGTLSSLEFREMTVGDETVDFQYSASSSVDLTVHNLSPDMRVGARDATTGEIVATGSIDGTGSGTITDLPSGSHTITLDQAPETIDIREESAPHNLLDNATVEVVASGDEETVSRQQVTDGQVDLAGLPTDQEYVVVVDAPGYHLRSIIVEDMFEQSNVFVLNESIDSVQNAFFIEDNTGQYSEPKLIIDKAINRSLYDSAVSEADQWTTIGGDRLGADSRYIVDLAESDRYRISIENADGDRRVLGEYTAASDGTVTLTVGDISWDVPSENGFRFETFQQNETGTEEIVVQFDDENDNTAVFCAEVYEAGNESNVLFPEDCATNLGEYKANIPLTGDDLNTSWVVEWSATVDGVEYGGVVPVTGIDEFPIPIPEPWLSTIIYVVLIGGLAATPKSAARTGAIIIWVFAFGLTMWGWVAIPWPALAITGAVALLAKAADFNKGYP